MLQGRYKVPGSTNPKSNLARHEAGLFQENRAVLTSCSHHRSDEVNRLILPQCQAMIEAIGHRMAYDAAVAAGVQQNLIDLYEVSCMKLDAAWYSEEVGIGRRALAAMETLRIYRPRVVLHGPVGMGQGYVAAAALHHLEGYHIQSLDLGTLMSDSTRVRLSVV